MSKHVTMKMYWGGGTAPHILDLGTRSGHFHALTALPWAKSSQNFS